MEKIESIPEAKMLLTSLRSVGYSEETAIADIIDNSIFAQAKNIDITFDWDKKRIVILDDGIGMDAQNLIENMRIGSSNPYAQRHKNDLGRFGMGMKTAALSLGERLIVVTKYQNTVSNAVWDLEQVAKFGWNLLVFSPEDVAEFASMLKKQGTAIVIENLDRVVNDCNSEKAKKKFFSLIKEVDKHLALTFHRFIEEDGLKLRINEKEIVAWNPFIPSNVATQELPDETVCSDDGETEVLIQPYVLPHKTKFANDREFQEAGGAKGWNYHQGIYVYRNRRLIIYGTWFNLIKKEPAYNLARIKVDISSTSDNDWKIDIKKSTAALPIYIRDSIERAINNCTERSAQVYNSRGVYSKSNTSAPNLDYVWEQYKRHGRYSYRINKKHALLISLRNQLSQKGIEELEAFLLLAENFAPFMCSGVIDTLPANGQKSASKEKEENLIDIGTVEKLAQTMISKGFDKEEIKCTLLGMPNYRYLQQEIINIVEKIL